MSVDTSKINFWQVKGRPSTEKRIGQAWVGMPGGENPEPGTDYRIAVTWGARMRINDTENYLTHVQLRVYFDGWKFSGTIKYRNSMQFYMDQSFTTATSTPYAKFIDHNETVFRPTNADILDYAYFRVLHVRDRAWRMHYNIGLYGAVYNGSWRKVVAL